jgi:hypothetical protein
MLMRIATAQPTPGGVTPTPYSIRTATGADRDSISRLIGELAPTIDPVRRLDWLYTANPQGAALSWLAIDGATGETAGVTSYFPFDVCLAGGEVVHGALGGDGFVVPKFRRRGIASALHAAARADMPRCGIELMFGAPTGANVSPLRAGGSTVVGQVERYFRPLRGRAFGVSGVGDKLAAKVLAPRAGGETLDPVVADDPRVDAVWARTRGELGIATVRDARFYTWRFVRAPAQHQRPYIVLDGDQPVAVCALERLDDRMRIIDLVAPADEWDRALAAIERHAADCDAVEIKLLHDDAAKRGLWRYGFVPRETKPFLCVLPETTTRAVLLDPARWFYTGADSDIDTLEE